MAFFFFFFLDKQWCACAGDDKRVCPVTQGRIPQLHDCPKWRLSCQRFAGGSLFICIFSTDVKVQLCFPPWHLKTIVLKSNGCEDVSSSWRRELVLSPLWLTVASEVWLCCFASSDKSARFTSSPLTKIAPWKYCSPSAACSSLIKTPHCNEICLWKI